MKTKWDALITKISFEYAELSKDIHFQDQLLLKAKENADTLQAQIKEMQRTLDQKNDQLAIDARANWQFLKQLFSLQERCQDNIAAIEADLDDLNREAIALLKEKKKYEMLAENQILREMHAEIRKEDEELDDKTTMSWRFR